MGFIKFSTTAIAAALQLSAGQAMAQHQCDLLKTATDFIAKEFPSFDPTGLNPVVSDTGNLWELTYELPRGTLGGTPIVTIDKQSCKVIRARHSQ